MTHLMTTTALALVLAAGAGGPVLAQAQPGTGGQVRTGTAPGAQELPLLPVQQAEQALRQAQQQISAGGPGQGQGQGQAQAAMEQARQAVAQAQRALGQMPAGVQNQEPLINAQRQVRAANDALLGQQPDRQEAAQRLLVAANALTGLRLAATGNLPTGAGPDGARAASAGAAGSSADVARGAQIAVQQPAPRVAVQQPAPEITVTQPPPEVTVIQPPPQITFYQPPPEVRVHQPPPQVSVRQPQAQVSVDQPEPRVTVQQSQPRIQVQQPEPQVTVRQPEPQVRVQQAQPQVSVQQPPPQVSVRQPEPQVSVRQPEPQVTVRQPEPQVRVQQAQPQVQVQSRGEPQVQVQQTGQAQVRVVERDQAQVRTTERDQASATGTGQGIVGRQAAAMGVPLTSVQDLVGTNLVGANGRDAGEIQNLLIDRAGNVRAAVVEWGGFLGLGDREAVVPLDQIQLGANASDPARMNLTREQLEALPRYDRNALNDYGTRFGWGEGVRTYR